MLRREVPPWKNNRKLTPLSFRRRLEAIEYQSQVGRKERISYETFVKGLIEDDVAITNPMGVSPPSSWKCNLAASLISTYRVA